jgi:23S rRNA (guanosine2251-2'-O)-methyltransferase
VLYGVHPVREALRARRRRLGTLWLAARRGRPELDELRQLAEEAGSRVLTAGPGMPAAPPGANTQGVLLEVEALPELGVEALAGVGHAPRILVALDGVEDPQNLGAIARVVEAAGASGLLLTRRHAPPLSAAVARASAGAIEWLPVGRVPNLTRALTTLKERGFWVLGAETPAPTPLFELPETFAASDCVVVLGAEGRGLRVGVRKALDCRVEIPMLGQVASLNVSAAAAVVLFELLRRRLATAP